MLTRFYFFCFSFAALVIVQQKYARKKNTQKLNYSPCEIDQTHFGIYAYVCVWKCVFFCASFFLVENTKYILLKFLNISMLA